nr:DUF2892 domain-containing protein [uncultured Undibacterium sp.]
MNHVLQKNVSVWERIVRIIAGATAVGASFYFLSGTIAIVAALSAVGISLTGLASFCPMCAMVGRRID